MNDTMYNKKVGNFGEMLVITYLENLNYKIIDKNYFTKYGEIDIIAKDNDEYVFIEVKTRTSNKYGRPAEAVNNNKERNIENASRVYIYLNKLENQYVRYDVIEVYFLNKNYYINHLKNNFF